jgi:nucleoside 2-deoxyribosyltransferase
VRSLLEEQGVHVLAPTGFRVVNPGAAFSVLEGDPKVEVRMVQDAFFAQIRNTTFLTVANVDGYLGKAVTFEMGYAVAYGLRILTLEAVNDPNLSGYVERLEAVFPAWMEE